MNQFKRAQVIMLPTNKEPIKGSLLLRHIWKGDPKLESNTLWQYKDTVIIDELKQYTTLNGSFRDWYKVFVAVNIYIISDDEIKEGDWHLNADKNVVTNTTRYTLYKATKIKLDFIKKLQEKNSDCKFYKIIATTDTSLTIKHKYSPYLRDWNLPQPSQQFIEKYIESYNKGNIITDVLVEYELYNTKPNSAPIYGKFEEKLKVNPKDNTITIKKLKDSWNREEIIEQMWSAYKAANTVFEDESALRVEFNNWIGKNL